MTSISLCLIAKNEDKSLPQCLDSVRDLVDEIVVLDTGSSDRTVEVARSYNAKVDFFAWCDDFAAARNAALPLVETEWVLILDADEQLNPEIIQPIRQATQHSDALVINLVREEVGAAQSPYSAVSRLFRRHPQIKFTRPYHATIDDSVEEILKQEPHWQIRQLDPVAVYHYGYSNPAIAAGNKFDRARVAMESYLADHPQDPYTCSKLGALYLQLGEIPQAIKLLKQGLKGNLAGEPVLYELHYSLANAYAQQAKMQRSDSRVQSAVKHYQKAIATSVLPKLKLGAYNNLGGLLHSVGALETAAGVFRAAIKIDPNFAKAYYNLGMVYRAAGGLEQAIACYQKAVKLQPNFAEAYQNLGVVYYKTGQLPECVAALDKAAQLHQGQNPAQAAEIYKFLTDIGFNPQ